MRFRHDHDLQVIGATEALLDAVNVCPTKPDG
jgi:hypothetical protein